MHADAMTHEPEQGVVSKRKFDLNALLDYFIPVDIQVQPDAHRRARMFMLSHAFGPFLGNVIPLYLHFILKIEMDYRFWTFFVSITIFWLYPVVLRLTKQYQLLAFLSIQNLAFCILWSCYSYGGVYSPFLSWTLIIPLLSFFYLPATGLIRNVILAQILLSVGIFAGLVVSGYAFPAVDLRDFEFIGIISTLSASCYVVMMALYFANVFREQRTFERELGGLVATADHMINLTAAAQQASMAKADFVASMSHELRTPLNAVIGYSQILLEDADEKGDEAFGADVKRIHDAGAHLLRLIDDILDFSKLEAGRMVLHPSTGSLQECVAEISTELAQSAVGEAYSIDCRLGKAGDPLELDWHTIKKAVQHLVYGVATEGGRGVIRIHAVVDDQNIAIQLTDPKIRDSKASAERLFDVFSDDSDSSATKYGGVGIAFALSLKFAQLLGGDIAVDSDYQGRRNFVMTIPVAKNVCADLAAA